MAPFGDEDNPKHKKRQRRLQGSCDSCRRRKVKCDSANMPAGVCSNCIPARIECSHLIAKKKRGPKSGNATGQQEISAVGTPVDAVLSTTTPYVLPNDPADVARALSDLARRVMSLEQELAARPTATKEPIPANSQGSTTPDRDETGTRIIQDDAERTTGLSDATYEMHIGETRLRHYGTGSRPALAQTVMHIWNEAKGPGELKTFDTLPLPLKRTEFWEISPWQRMPEHGIDTLCLS